MTRLLALAFSVMACIAACASDDGNAARSQCGGLAGGACADNQFCAYSHGTCGSGDDAGTCTGRPENCSNVVDPVCGCDGKTYPNECYAQTAGTDVASQGACS